MDLNVYAAQKAKGLGVLTFSPPATVVYVAPKFDANTGSQGPGEVHQFNLKGLDDEIAALQANLAALQAFRADVAAVIEAK